MLADENLPQADEQLSSGLNHDDYYSYLLANPWIQQAIATYNWTKQSSKLLESTLNCVETSVSNAAQTAAQKTMDVHQNYYVRPKEAVASAYNAGLEKTKSAAETSKNIAVHTGTLGLGAAVVATQLSLTLSTGGALWFLNTLGGVQQAGQNLLTSVRDAEKMVEEKIWSAVAEGQRVAKIPIDKVAESTNAFLDVVSVLVERSLGITVQENPESSVADRVSTLARKVVEALNDKAHKQVIDPVTTQLRGLLDHLSRSFVLADLIRSKREWALEKVEELSTSVTDLKARIETEAKQCCMKPEELLMRSIRSTSTQLRENLKALKDKQVFSDGTRLDSAIVYLQELDTSLGESDDIYQVRDEVLSEARQRLTEFTVWTTNLLAREKQ